MDRGTWQIVHGVARVRLTEHARCIISSMTPLNLLFAPGVNYVPALCSITPGVFPWYDMQMSLCPCWPESSIRTDYALIVFVPEVLNTSPGWLRAGAP